MKTLIYLLVILTLLLCSVGCSPPFPATPGSDPTVGKKDSSQTTTPIPSPVIDTLAENSTELGTDTTTPTQPENPPKTSIINTPTTAVPTELPFLVCSPLAIHRLEELREIISDPYRPPPPGKEQRHHGIDFSYYRRGDLLSIQGVGVQSVLDGVVAASLMETYPYGNLVIIETPYDGLPQEWVDALEIPQGESIYSLYAHMDEPEQVSLGESISACQPLGLVGVSGNTVEPHLHLEMRLGPPDEIFTGMAYYGAKDTEEERSNYLRWRTGEEYRHFNPMLILTGLDETQMIGD